MKTDETKVTGHARFAWLPRALAVLALTAAATGCSVTQQEKPEMPSGSCALIPPDYCARLVAGTSDEAGLRYIAPNVPWSQYTKVMIKPVTLWGGEVQKLSDENQQALADYLFNALVSAFGKKFPVVDKGGPGVVRLQAAITEADTATPILRSVSMGIPQARVLGTLKLAVTGTYPFVGSAQGEVLLTDSVTGKVLAAAVDRRVGGGSIANVAVWQWGDAENAMDKWSEMAVTRFEALRAGK